MPYKAEYARLKAAGTCVRCKRRPATDGTTACSECREERREGMQFLKSRGLCQLCGKERPAPGLTVCETCAEVAKRNTKARHERNVAAGVCKSCGRPLPSKRFLSCSKCRERDAGYCRERYHLNRIKRRER